MHLTHQETTRLLLEAMERTLAESRARQAELSRLYPHLVRASDIRRARDERKGAMQ